MYYIYDCFIVRLWCNLVFFSQQTAVSQGNQNKYNINNGKRLQKCYSF